MNNTYLTTEELSTRIKYDPRTIRDQLKDSVLLEGRHYIRPFDSAIDEISFSLKATFCMVVNLSIFFSIYSL